MSEAGVDVFWQETFENIAVFEELEKHDNRIQELLTQFRACLAIESPDPSTLKQLGYYLDYACQILRFASIEWMEDVEKCARVIGFIGECRDLLNAALAKPLSDIPRQYIAHYVENQSSRILGIRQMAERGQRR